MSAPARCPDITADVAAQALSLAAAPHRPEAVAVLVASRDPDTIAQAGPLVARALYPGRTFGRVLWHQPHPDPVGLLADRLPGQWSEVAIEETRP